MGTAANCESEPGMTEFVKFFDTFVGSHQVTENWRRFGLTVGRHAREIGNTDDANNIADLNWRAGYVVAR